MEILKLVMGDDDKACLLCRFPSGEFPAETKLPWLLCPPHFGDLYDDPKIREMVEEAKAWKGGASHE